MVTLGKSCETKHLQGCFHKALMQFAAHDRPDSELDPKQMKAKSQVLAILCFERCSFVYSKRFTEIKRSNETLRVVLQRRRVRKLLFCRKSLS